ncbi:MAG: two-component regulator propeller domain-containing protein [Chryseolinea sp.]
MKIIVVNRCCTCLLVLICQSLSAQHLFFERVKQTQDVSWSGFITAITQDKDGYIWFTASNGLFRYDGYEVKPFVHDFSDPNSVSPGNLTSVYADRDGIIWIGTEFSGLNRLDPASGIITRYVHSDGDSKSLITNSVMDIVEDNDGMMWLGTYEGLDHFDRKTGKSTHYRYNPNDSTTISNNTINNLYIDKRGTLWAATYWGLNRFNKSSGTFTRYIYDPDNQYSIIDNNVRDMLEDSQGNFWVGTYHDGLHIMNREKGTFQRLRYDSLHPEKLSRPYLQNGDPHFTFFATDGNGINFIQEANGEIWIGVNHGGLNRYNLKTKQLTHFEPDPNEENGLTDHAFMSAFTSRDGELFLGTCRSNGHLYTVNPTPKIVSLHPSGRAGAASQTAFHVDTHDRLWTGAGWGLIIEDRKTGRVFQNDILKGNNDATPKPDDWAHVLYKDRDEYLWIGTRRGLFRYNEKSEEFTHYTRNSKQPVGIASDTILSLFEDRLGNFWVGTGKSLDKMNRSHGTFTHYSNIPNDSTTLSNAPVVDVLDDRNGNLWVITKSSWNSGRLNKLDRRTGRVMRYPNITDVIALAEDDHGLWITTRNNLYCMDPKTEKVTKFIDPQTGQGLIGLLNILQDTKGNFWVTTLTGIIQINPSRDRVRRVMTSGDTFVPGAYQGKRNFQQSASGEIFFGTWLGYYSFFPDLLPPPDTIPPQIVISDFRVGGGSIISGAQAQSRDYLHAAAASIELTYKEDAFSIDFASIHYRHSELNQHMFKLENYENNWRQSSMQRTAYYYNVPPGTYTFKVRGSNGDGIWAERSLKIIIHPPWWRTLWAYVIFTAILAAVLIAFVRNRIQRARERQQLEKKEWEAEQLKAVDEMKTRFFSNITHEFRTPLSLIIPATDQLMSEVTPKQQNRLSVIKRQARQLLQLINQLLDLSKLESGSMRISESQGDISMFTSSLLDSFRPSAEERGIALQYDSQVKSGDLRFDTEKWGKIVLNLLSNALKFTPAGGEVTLRLMSKTADETSSVIMLTVEDTGLGIDQDKLPHIFDRFYQIDNSSTRSFEGSGIGLSLVKEMVELLGGSVTVESEIGNGTTFSVSIVMKRADPNNLPSSIAPALSIPPMEDLPKENGADGNTIAMNEESIPLLLIVEDHQDLREFIVESFSTKYRVITATNGEQAWNATKQQLPDVVISDIMMPGMDGLSLTDLIKKDPITDHIGVVLLSARSSQESKVSGLTLGADDYITKPFHLEELELRVRNLLEHQQKQRQRFQRQLTTEETIQIETVQDKFWKNVCKVIECNLDNSQFDVNALAESLAMSRRTLYRKLSTLSGLTPNDVIRNYRLKRATQLLRAGNTVSDTAYQVGFESPSYFGQCFKEIYKITPSEYIQERMAQS